MFTTLPLLQGALDGRRPINGDAVVRQPEGMEDVGVMPQELSGKEQAELKKQLGLLVHTSSCEGDTCGWASCSAFKAKLQQFHDCQKELDGCEPCRCEPEQTNSLVC